MSYKREIDQYELIDEIDILEPCEEHVYLARGKYTDDLELVYVTNNMEYILLTRDYMDIADEDDYVLLKNVTEQIDISVEWC